MIKFFPIAYAGASSEQVFGGWQSALGEVYDVIPLEIAGRGRRASEPFHSSIDDAVEQLFHKIKFIISVHSYIIYGHSMGCILAFELVKKIEENNFPPPLRLCLSGRNPPDFYYDSRAYHRLPEEEFIDKVSALGGNLKHLFAVPDIRDVFLPILRADYRILGDYDPPKSIYKVSSDILFFFSHSDLVIQWDCVVRWKEFCKKKFRIFEFCGDHFFIHEQFSRICQHISEDILP